MGRFVNFKLEVFISHFVLAEVLGFRLEAEKQ